MISLRRHIDAHRPEAGMKRPGTKHPALDAFRSSLLAMAECSQRAVPALGSDLNQRLNDIAGSVRDDGVEQAADDIRVELSSWADRALERHQENEREIREIIGSVAKAAETIGVSGDKYSKEVGVLTARLRSVADMQDVSLIRRCILESTHSLKICMARMAEDSRSTVNQLTAEVSEYRGRLEESERVSRTDVLTSLANRRAFEKKLQAKVASRQAFSLLMLDMNGFKSVNDTYGHLAGDELLQLFAAELKAQFGPSDLVARWGGDEFAVIIAGALGEARDKAERIHRWVFGEYKLTKAQPASKVSCSAAIGIVEWDGRESESELLARVDKEVYKAKTVSP